MFASPHRAAVVLALAALLAAAAPAPAPAQDLRQPDKLLILSTSDVKGKTGPCGCQVPKGGFARRAGFADSLRGDYGRVLVVDAGGFFPEGAAERERAAFQLAAMKRIGVEAATVGERDLGFGLAFLREQARARGFELVSANLVDRRTGKPAFAPWTLREVGGVKVGLFGLLSPQAALGPAADSLRVEDPIRAATASIAELRKRGATVVVLLSQLGKIDGEDLLMAVDGVDAAVLGRNIPVIPRGRLIRSTVASYAGEEGQYIGCTELTLGAGGAVTTGETATVALLPSVREPAEVAEMVKTFEAAHAQAPGGAAAPGGAR